ncbi:MAG: M56 family metallopeptidase [Bacteroidota bacterium]
MLLTVIPSALVDQLITALSNTLMYSLLQGVALAAAGGLIILVTRKASAATRYNLLVAALVVFTLGSAVTFGVQFANLQQVQSVAASSFNGRFDIPAITSHTLVSVPQKTNYLALISAFVNTHHNAIVLVWFVFICIKAIQMAVGLQNIYQLKRTGTQPADAFWPQRMQEMAQRLGTKKVALLESAMAKVPMVIGHLKPVILIPIGLLTALSTAEVEAILMHELAHISRRDYLVNLLLSLVEVIFFFNPAVLWISQSIKTERENCCDDIALAQTNSKHNYIQALVSCEEYQQSKTAYAVAFSGQKNSLVSRVKRMISNRNHSLNIFEKAVLTIFLVMSGVLLSAFAEKETIKKTIHQVVKAISAKGDKQTRIVDATPAIVLPVKQTLAPVADVVEAPKEKVPENETTPPVAAVPQPLTPQLALPRDTGRRIIKSTSVITSLSINASSSINLKEIQRQDAIDRADALTVPAVRKIDQSSLIIMDEMVKDGLIEKGKPLPYSLSERGFAINGVQQSEALAKKYWLLKIGGEPAQYAKNKEADERQRRMLMNAVVLQMGKDKLIGENDEHLTFKLDNNEFVVNGKKQPDAVFQEYLNEFVKKHPGGKLSLSYTNVID